MLSTKTRSIFFLTSLGISATSRLFLAGRMSFLTLALSAARAFSLSPPTAKTLPRSDISPVMATSRRMGMPARAETMAVARLTPAEGPSLGMAPAGRWRWMSMDS